MYSTAALAIAVANQKESQVLLNNKKIIKPYELDIYLPEINIAFEFNGLYWHNEQNRGKTYHDDKTHFAISASIKLMHVFEDEWRVKRDIVKSMIAARLGVFERKLGARQCVVREITKQERIKFFNENHVDGDVPSKIAYGLFSPAGDLVSALSLRVPEKKKKYDAMEVARFAVAKNTSVSGALGKLSKHALSQAGKQLMTYVDLRFGSTQETWERAGWKCIGETPVRWWWTNDSKRYNRRKFKADKKRGMSEKQVAEEAGVKRIYGCKNLVFTLNVQPICEHDAPRCAG